MNQNVTALFGMPGFEVCSTEMVDGEWYVAIETPRDLVGCGECGAVARVKDRRTVTVRDLPAAGVPVVIRWRKRIFECRYALCPNKTWTELHPAIASRAVLTDRARQWGFEQVGRHDRAVAPVAAQLGVGWHTIMRQVTERGKPLIDDPKRLDGVSAIGVDETAFLRACSTHPTLYATGIADLTPGRPARLLDVAAGRSGTVLSGWLAARDDDFRTQIVTASLDPFRGYATALAAQLPQTVRVLDAFHVVKLALTCVDEVRRRTQQDTLGHRGFAHDPLFRTRRLLRRRADRLTIKQRAKLLAALLAGDPNDEVTAAWVVAQDLMAAYANPDRTAGRAAAEQLITTARTCPVPEITRLGRTLTAWRTEFLARFDHPGVSNGPTECLNLKVKNTKRVARGYRSFANYRLRLLLNHGLIRDDQATTRIRTRRPRMVA
ncbi:ISL3 family transposase [Nakamurella sp.]|uniref:ISL3 family transposase n=1 Tax=Nakamurella sp. TaxID=1869182 RepID=UPI0037846F55